MCYSTRTCFSRRTCNGRRTCKSLCAIAHGIIWRFAKTNGGFDDHANGFDSIIEFGYKAVIS